MMFDKFDVYRTEWLDLVFANRNKAYGAYELRQHNAQTTLKALFVASALMVGAVVGSYSYTKLTGSKNIVPAIDPFPTEKETVVHFAQPPKPKNIEQVAPKAPAERVKAKSIVFVAPRVVPAPQVTDNMPSMVEIQQSVIGSVKVDGERVESNVNPIAVIPVTGNGSTAAAENEIVGFEALEQFPEFPGGEAAFARYLSRNMRYPASARENDISGKVIVSFVIEKNGDLSNIQILRGIGWGCDEEAIRVLKNAPAWAPGKQNGQMVRVAYTMPISFQLAR